MYVACLGCVQIVLRECAHCIRGVCVMCRSVCLLCAHYAGACAYCVGRKLRSNVTTHKGNCFLACKHAYLYCGRASINNDGVHICMDTPMHQCCM